MASKAMWYISSQMSYNCTVCILVAIVGEKAKCLHSRECGMDRAHEEAVFGLGLPTRLLSFPSLCSTSDLVIVAD